MAPRIFKRRKSSTKPRKVLFLGNAMVGKSTLIHKFRTGDFDEQIKSTAAYDHCHLVQPYEYGTVHLSIYDLAGDEDWEHIRRFTYPKTDVIILCYDVTDRISFNDIMGRWQPELRQIHSSGYCPILLVGTKTDGRPSTANTEDNPDYVTKAEGLALVKELSGYAYIECSSKTGSGVRDIFNAATVMAVQHKSMGRRIMSFFSGVFTLRWPLARR